MLYNVRLKAYRGGSPPRRGVTPTIALKDGRAIPQLGSVSSRSPGGATQGAVATACAAGYRHADTAAAYRNEGDGSAAIRARELESVWVTTKPAKCRPGCVGVNVAE